MYFERTIEATVRNVSETFPILLLTGPRQVGKSTLLERIAEPERKRVSLDNPTIRALAQTDPELFLQRYAPPVLIDEVQYAPELFPYIKIHMQQNRIDGLNNANRKTAAVVCIRICRGIDFGACLASKEHDPFIKYSKTADCIP